MTTEDKAIARVGGAYVVMVAPWTDKAGNPRGGHTHVCTLVDVLPSSVAPEASKIDRYYGKDAPSGAYRPGPFDRLIFARQDDPEHFMIVPDAPRNRRLWWEHSQ